MKIFAADNLPKWFKDEKATSLQFVKKMFLITLTELDVKQNVLKKMQNGDFSLKIEDPDGLPKNPLSY